MESTENIFEIEVNDGQLVKTLHVRPEQTTDGISIYHCYSADGALVCELRQETSGEWVQLWGSFPADSVEQMGNAIASQSR
ncbi:hypothetical protein [Parapedobacter soli]|uniref:hypothetical protein n=1 Tax=Parapedobacter soli TaxID=416955 RepID=UPI0021CA4731|nr:hypothetical protein [Parapedobacter soli]